MFSNMCSSLIEHELIRTTLPKAKELRKYLEPLITASKSDSVAGRRYVFDRLRSREAVTKLFDTLGPRYEERPGGYLRVLKCGYRPGDNAPMAIVELVDRVRKDDESEIQTDKPKTEKASKKSNKAEEVKKSAEAKVESKQQPSEEATTEAEKPKKAKKPAVKKAVKTEDKKD